MFKDFVKDYLTFSRKERVGIISIITLVIASLFIPWLIKNNHPVALIPDSTLVKAIDTLQQQSHTTRFRENEFEITSPDAPEKVPDFTEGDLFDFDPNSLSGTEWKRLGLSDKITRILINYRNKGGRFYKKEDILKIWGMPVDFYERIKDHIIIPGQSTNNKAVHEYTSFKPKEKPVIDVNTADSLAFVDLPGIGPKLSERIIRFRDKLGGFYSINQLQEVYGLPDSTFRIILPQLTLKQPLSRTININTVSKDELKSHPYIRWALANAIVEYRNQHGNFTSLDDLLNINLLDEQTFRKIKPYLVL